MKLSKEQKDTLNQKLPHYTGECLCPPDTKSCVYWQKVDKQGNWQTEGIIKLVEGL